MWAADAASAALGMRLVELGPGEARVSMVVRPDMVNGHDLCHGGLIATLADSTFALACNSHGPVTVAAGFTVDGQEVPAAPAEVVDTTGAGDALAAGFLVGGPELAAEAAARCVAKLGAMP